MAIQTAMDIERRILPLAETQIRTSGGGKPKLVGYAAKYNVTTDLGSFKEKIRRGAFDSALKNSDARALKNHDANLLLGRESSGTLRLESNSTGLRFEIDVPDTTTGRDTLEEVRRGDIQGCSFSFQLSDKGVIWNRPDGQDGVPERTIISIKKLFDVGPVTYPSYEDTTVAIRSLALGIPARAKRAADTTEMLTLAKAGILLGVGSWGLQRRLDAGQIYPTKYSRDCKPLFSFDDIEKIRVRLLQRLERFSRSEINKQTALSERLLRMFEQVEVTAAEQADIRWEHTKKLLADLRRWRATQPL